MIESGSNIRIVQNEFKVDNIVPGWPFPSVDIQVGDANLGDIDIKNAQNYDDADKTTEPLIDSPDPVVQNEFELAAPN